MRFFSYGALGVAAKKAKEIGLATEADQALGVTVIGGVEREPEEAALTKSGMIVTPGRLMNR